MNRMRAGIQSITTLINELLDMGRIEAGFDTRRESIHLENVLQYSLDTLESLVTEKDLHLEKTIAPNLPSLRANPIRIRQMLDNLIANAIKFTPAHGTIRVKLDLEDRQLIFTISDNGPGIPLREQPRIFEKFYRASNVMDGSKGSGLGLAIVKSIVDSHQGRVWVESTEGKGSTFTVVLPTLEAENAAPVRSTSP